MSASDGKPEPFTEDGHRAEVEKDRDRVVCTECPWFAWMPGESASAMRSAAYRHRKATTLR